MTPVENACQEERPPEESAASANAGVAVRTRPIRVFMMDLWCSVPYYDGYLCKGLTEANVNVSLGAISYYLDREVFTRQGVPNAVGLLDIVSHLEIQNAALRRLLKSLEFSLNLPALAVRFLFSRPDVLHVQFAPLLEKGLPFELWFLGYARKLGIKLVYTVHNVLPHDARESLRAMYLRVYRLADALICHNEATRAKLIEDFGVNPARVWVIPHGPIFHDRPRLTVREARAQLGYGPQECIVLWLGIVKPYKGIDFLLKAWQRTCELGAKARLIVAGTGEEAILRDVQEQVRALGVGESVRLDLRFLRVEEVSLYYQAADIVVYPYKEITTSGALMTGVNYEKAIVATDLPSFREVLKDGENACLVEYGDVEALAGTLARLIEKPEERSRLAAGIATAIPARDPWAPIALSTRDCYRAVISRR